MAVKCNYIVVLLSALVFALYLHVSQTPTSNVVKILISVSGCGFSKYCGVEATLSNILRVSNSNPDHIQATMTTSFILLQKL